MSRDWTRFLGTLRVAVHTILLVTMAASLFSAQEQKPPHTNVGLQKAPAVGVVESLPKGPMAEKAATACTECHEARIILQQRLSKAAWTKEVDKMVKWGAVVEPNDRDALSEYLSTNFGPDQPAYEAPRTSIQKRGAGKTSQ